MPPGVLPPATPVIGRAPELATLATALADAEAARGNTVLLVGESGIGKTCLALAIAARAAQRGFIVAVGRAYKVESGVPYAVFADALVPVIRAVEPSVLTLLTRGGAPELAQLFPTLNAVTPTHPESRGDPAELKARLLWNFTQFLSRFSAKHPMVVLLENLQWADSASLEMLHFVTRQITGDRLLVIGTHNDPDHRGTSALRATEQSIRTLGNAQRIQLAPLTVSAVGELLERVFAADQPRIQHFAERLHRWTGGNPFFIDETLKSLIDGGQLRQGASGWTGWGVEELRVPATIREALLTRLADLSSSARRLADIAAVLGARATHDELAAVTGLDEDRLIASIDELRLANVLTEREDAADIVYDFSHPLLQETLYAEVGLARARTLHGAVAESLEKLYGPRAMARADELAFHYARGDTRRLAGKAIEYLRVAGKNASEKYANSEAADYLGAALSIADQHQPPAEAATQIAADLARVRQRLGDYAGSLALWTRALDAAVQAGDLVRVATIERRIGLARYWSGAFGEALTHCEAAAVAADRAGDQPLIARVLIAKATCLQAMGRAAEAREDVERALALALALGDDALSARVHGALVIFYVPSGQADKARAHGKRAVALADASGQRSVAWAAHWALATLGGLTGQEQEIRRHLVEAQRIADELRSPLFRVWTSEVEIEYAAGIGDWDHGVALAERTIAMARSLGQRTLLPRVLVWGGLLYLGRGDVARGKACVDEAWELSVGGAPSPVRDVFAIVPAYVGRAAYHLTVGEYAQAIAVGEKGLSIADNFGHIFWALHRLMPIIAEASLWANDLERAAALAERMRSESALLGQQLGLAWADACDAVVEMMRGDKHRAVLLLRNAIAALEAIPYVPDAARLRRQLARALAETGDRDGATRELRRAHELFAHLGAARELEATREQLRELGTRPPSRAAGPGIAGLTGREVEIVRLVAARRSNKAIGAALQISARTVSTHLSNIFAKLTVESRGELADLARQSGLLDGPP